MKFRMVDQILAFAAAKSIRGAKTVSFEEYTSKDAFGTPPQLPATLAMESLIQLGSWLIMLSSEFREIGLLESIEAASFDHPLGPGERMLVQVEVESWGESVAFAGTGRSARGQVVACESWQMTRRPLDQHHSAEDLRVLSSQIYRLEESSLT
jgi:3-hydroxyacyl-[acyl-carrier-protein] dehydratase